MADIYIDPITGDMPVTDDIRFTQGIETVVQLIELRLSAVQGEWRYDLDNGIDYLGEIWGAKPDKARIASIFRKVLIDTEGVDRVTELTVDYNDTTRVFSIDWQVLALGEFIDGSRDI